MAEISTPLMTRYEMGRLAEIKAQGVPHEQAKARVYAERGPSGEPRTGPVIAPPAAPAATKPSAPVVVVKQAGISPWWGILALLAVMLYFGSRQQPVVVAEIPSEPDDIGETPTGVIARPRRYS